MPDGPNDPVVETQDGVEIHVNRVNSKFFAIIGGERYEAQTLTAVRTRINREREGVKAFHRESYDTYPRFTTHKNLPAVVIKVSVDERHGYRNVTLYGRNGKPIMDDLYVWDEERIRELKIIEQDLNTLMEKREELFKRWPRFNEAAFDTARAQRVDTHLFDPNPAVPTLCAAVVRRQDAEAVCELPREMHAMTPLNMHYSTHHPASTEF